MFRLIALLARGSSVLSAVALFGMMSVTIVDITLRGLWNAPIRGNVEIVQFLLVCFVFFALPEVFLRFAHITVDVIDGFLSNSMLKFLRIVAAAASFGLVGLMLWRMIPEAIDTYEFGGVTLDLRVGYYWYWLPIVMGVALSSLAALVALTTVLFEQSSRKQTDAP